MIEIIVVDFVILECVCRVELIAARRRLDLRGGDPAGGRLVRILDPAVASEFPGRENLVPDRVALQKHLAVECLVFGSWIASAVVNPARETRFDRRIAVFRVLPDRDRHALVLRQDEVDPRFAAEVADTRRAVVPTIPPEPRPELIPRFRLIDSSGAERIRDLADLFEHPRIRHPRAEKAVRPDLRRNPPRNSARTHPGEFGRPVFDEFIRLVVGHDVIPRAMPS